MNASCICLTHGRPWLLAEAVESFRRQRLGNLTAELVIVNDCIEQALTCDVPGVRIVQGMPQFPACCEKYNYAFTQSRGEWLVFWDDDDISLPWRVADLIDHAATRPGCVMVRPRKLWHMANKTIRGWGGATLCNGMVRASAVAAIGGANPAEFVDQSLAFTLPKHGAVLDYVPSAECMAYVYRWDGIGYHDSGATVRDPAERSRRFHAAAVADPRFSPGAVHVLPEWTMDYEAEARLAITNGLGNKRV
jgi:glycosyltransferase involved in cell wall biosynthesis